MYSLSMLEFEEMLVPENAETARQITALTAAMGFRFVLRLMA